MSRSTDAQKAERLNAAHRLLARGQSVGEAALSLSRQFAMSRRQAYRYIEEAQLIGRPVPVVETAMAVTFKLPPSLVDAVRARAAAEGITDWYPAANAAMRCRGRQPAPPRAKSITIAASAPTLGAISAGRCATAGRSAKTCSTRSCGRKLFT